MIYGLAYGTSADAVLNQLLERDSLRRRFNNPPVRLKPLRQQALSFEPQHVLTPGVWAALQQGTLILRGIEAQSSEVVIQGRLRNTYYPQEIRAARVAIALASGGGPDKAAWLQGEIEPAVVTNLPPGGSIEDIRIRIHLPRFSVWSLDTLFAEGYGAKATLMISLTAQELVLSQRFQEQMDHIFGLGQLPEIFLPGASDSTSETSVPVLLQVNYPAWPLAVLMLLAILALIALAILVTALNRERRFIIELEGNRLAVAIRPFRTQPVRSAEGRPVAEITGTLFGKPRLKRLEQKTRVEIR